ncbi:hypothetical protein M406DRAFT_326833 [Cryphonectria parasitica EP155]|uniref:Uncharacterized protein n=1 Tax=Cryphonectria parasitica (strain ATCC 38755 / EP155) TaxID=660469 RepID=A0A9P4Y7C4_CRYP1|nr:uncharacterized protein M406DRAFT_326833 [Cryphonectria parasitica EP155]KAF3768247.1 hypothetical protein M406DRAFT_326833 [Cryphonectria parasitica EP155]
MPPTRKTKGAHLEATKRDSPMVVQHLVCMKCATITEYDCVPSSEEPITLVCQHSTASSSSCDVCSAGNKVCQQKRPVENEDEDEDEDNRANLFDDEDRLLIAKAQHRLVCAFLAARSAHLSEWTITSNKKPSMAAHQAYMEFADRRTSMRFDFIKASPGFKKWSITKRTWALLPRLTPADSGFITWSLAVEECCNALRNIVMNYENIPEIRELTELQLLLGQLANLRNVLIVHDNITKSIAALLDG